jgi:Beta-propeller repeat
MKTFKNMVWLPLTITVCLGLSSCQHSEPITASGSLVVPSDRGHSPQSTLSKHSSSNLEQQQNVNQSLGSIKVPFIPNFGQLDSSVSYYARTFGGTVFITGKGEIVYSLPTKADLAAGKNRQVTNQQQSQLVLTERLAGAHVNGVTGGRTSKTQVSIFHGNDPAKHQNSLATYEEVSLGHVYPGVELRLSAHGNSVEKLFYIFAGANPDDIQIEVSHGKMSVADSGQLQIETDKGAVQFSRPVAWQDIGGKRIDVAVAYATNLGNNRTYGFHVGSYDSDYLLMIDPLLQSTYLGGNDTDSIRDLVIGPNGHLYVTGGTSSSDFPVCSSNLCFQGADHTFEKSEAFVAEISPDLKQLFQTTYLGGSDSDSAAALAIDSSGNVFLTGETSSSDFPGLSGGADATLAGSSDGFVAKLSPNLRTLYQSTLVGGGSREMPRDIGISNIGKVLVTGTTLSNDLPDCTTSSPPCFPPGQPDSVFGGASEGFVALFAPDLKEMPIATYLGGSNRDDANGLAIAANGAVYVSGTTRSNDFPSIAGGFDTSCQDYYDAFITKFASDLSGIDQSTFYGGSDYEDSYGIALSADSTVYLIGETSSTDLPHCSGPGCQSRADEVMEGSGDGFAARFSQDLQFLYGSTYLGGTDFDVATEIVLVSKAQWNSWDVRVYIAGDTYSPDFPGVQNGSADMYSGGSDGFITYLDRSLTRIQQASYIGGSGTDEAMGLAVSLTGDIYVAGLTRSINFPKTYGSLGPVHQDRNDPYVTSDGYVTKFSDLKSDGSYYVIPRKNGKAAIIFVE